MSTSSNKTDDITKMQNMMTIMLFSKVVKKSMGNSPAFDIAMESVMKSMKEDKGFAAKAVKLVQDNLDSNLQGKMLNNNADFKQVLLNTDSRKNSISNSKLDEKSTKIERAIASAAKRYRVDASLIRAIIKQESDFDPNVTSWAGAMGLMQLMPENVEHYGVSDPYNIEQNIDAGTRHIKDYIKMYNGDVKMGLAAYNAGPGTLQRRGVKSESDFYKLPSETQNYVKIISKNLGI